jgi:hypothetical protein
LLPEGDNTCFGFILRAKSSHAMEASHDSVALASPRNVH